MYRNQIIQDQEHSFINNRGFYLNHGKSESQSVSENWGGFERVSNPSLEKIIVGLSEIYDSHLDFDQAEISDEQTRSENKSNFECRVCMRIPKKIFVCSNEDCCIPFCKECSDKIIYNSQCCPNRCSGQNTVLKVSGLIRQLRQQLENIIFNCKYYGCNQQHKYELAFRHLIECVKKPIKCIQGCQLYISPDKINDHIKQKCKLTVYKCDKCDCENSIKDSKNHNCLKDLQKQVLDTKSKLVQVEDELFKTKQILTQAENKIEASNQKNQLLEQKLNDLIQNLPQILKQREYDQEIAKTKILGELFGKSISNKIHQPNNNLFGNDDDY